MHMIDSRVKILKQIHKFIYIQVGSNNNKKLFHNNISEILYILNLNKDGQ